jgi:hypothetical protein
MKNFSSTVFEMACVSIAASLSGLLHPHQAGPLYTEDQIIDISTARALKLAKASALVLDAEALAQATPAPVTTPATGPSDSELAAAADKAAQETIASEIASLGGRGETATGAGWQGETAPKPTEPVAPSAEPTSAQTPTAKRAK